MADGRMDVDSVLEQIRNSPKCVVLDPCGVPTVSQGHTLPNDLERFYQLCGGVRLFEHADYGLQIVPPPELMLANPIIVRELCQGDITASWYIIAKTGAQETLTIDLHPKRLGRCYDSFWDRHGVPGECAIIAASFTELIKKLFANNGEYWYWLRGDFEKMGDAYDYVC